MIVPARWYSGGRGLDKFRENMLNDTHIRKLVDFINADECFPGVDISGGVCYFLWDRDHEGDCEVENINGNNKDTTIRRLNAHPVFVRSNAAVQIVDKVLAFGEESLSRFVSSQKPFGLRTYERPDDHGDLILRWNGGKGPVESSKITVGVENIEKWKVIVSRVFYEHGGKLDKNGQARVLSILEVLAPKEVCTETYVVVNSFDSEDEANHLYNYLSTKFVRFMILQATSSIMITRNSYMFVPNQDFTENWDDQKLYEKYHLTADEIAIVEAAIRPMEADGGDA